MSEKEQISDHSTCLAVAQEMPVRRSRGTAGEEFWFLIHLLPCQPH